jgi:hypothetical protein
METLGEVGREQEMLRPTMQIDARQDCGEFRWSSDAV